ncbi:MAG: circularly permuted type 2 ATP-grasp protein [Methylophaga sp.]|nr:circularly permuted type 2 ATP-grasp protein [Methylophaga sp.]
MMQAWRDGKVAIANALGCGVDDDKVIYAFVPEMIRYYLNQEPLLPNLPVWLCREPEHLRYILDNLPDLV